MKRLLILSAVLAMWAHSAQAAIIMSLDGIAPQPGSPGVWNWVYRASLQPDQSMLEQDFFTIYDFPSISLGDVSFGASLSPAVAGRSFATSVQGLGIDAPGTAIPDDAGIPNVTVRLTGGGEETKGFEPD